MVTSREGLGVNEKSVGEEVADLHTTAAVNTHVAPIDAFLDSISKPVPQPLLTPRPQCINVDYLVSTPQGTNKRQSTRLAKKPLSTLQKER
jgi:hypothetical protein